MILAKTIKGWTLGTDVEARNATHQIKKMTKAQLETLRARLHLDEVIPTRRSRATTRPTTARPRTRPSTATWSSAAPRSAARCRRGRSRCAGR